MKKQKPIKESNKQSNKWKNMYNIYAVLMTAFLSAISGFGMFWFLQLFCKYSVFYNIFIGMMLSALMYNTIKSVYPLKK